MTQSHVTDLCVDHGATECVTLQPPLATEHLREVISEECCKTDEDKGPDQVLCLKFHDIYPPGYCDVRTRTM